MLLGLVKDLIGGESMSGISMTLCRSLVYKCSRKMILSLPFPVLLKPIPRILGLK